MSEEVLTWIMIAAGSVAVAGTALVALGIALGDGLYAVVWPAAGWMIVLGLLVGAMAGVASLLDRHTSSR